MTGLQRLQTAMADEGIDALLLWGDGAGVFAGGHRRIGVHMPGWPMPMTVVTRTDAPHVVTADPDGATDLPSDRVHPLVWNPNTTARRLPQWLGAAASGVVGVDTVTPGGLELVRAALPHATLADAADLLARVRLIKSDNEIATLRKASEIAMRAAVAGLGGGLGDAHRALEGHFPASTPVVGSDHARVSVLFDSFIGEARIGPGDPATLHRAVAAITPGSTASQIAAGLPPGVEIVGVGRGYEAPVLRNGWGSPPDLRIEPGAVLLVTTATTAITVVVTDSGAQPLSAQPEDVSR